MWGVPALLLKLDPHKFNADSCVTCHAVGCHFYINIASHILSYCQGKDLMQEYTKNCVIIRLTLNILKYPVAKDLKICNGSGNTWLNFVIIHTVSTVHNKREGLAVAFGGDPPRHPNFVSYLGNCSQNYMNEYCGSDAFDILVSRMLFGSNGLFYIHFKLSGLSTLCQMWN
jgi:hypothetical protein